MLLTIALILFILWFLGFITAHTFGGWLYILLIAAVVMLVIRLFVGPPRPPVPPPYY